MHLKKLAAATSSQPDPPSAWMSELARSPSEAKPLLLYYRRPQLTRKLSSLTFSSVAIETPPGERLLLFKHPVPGEAQARLAYEYVFEKFTQFLEQRNYAVAEHQSLGHVMLWFPEQKPSNPSEWLEQEWSAFLTELTSAKGFRDSFALALNSSKLAGGAGFATLETPVFNQQHALSLAGLYWVAMGKGLEVNRRNFANTLELEKKAATTTKPSDATKALADAKKEQEKAAKFKQDVLKFLKASISKEKNRTAEVLQKVLTACNEDIQVLPQQLKQFSPETYKAVESASKSYGPTAREQLNSARGDIFPKIIWEMVKLAEGDYEVYVLPSLLSVKPFGQGTRLAGDANGQFCYSCGRALSKKEQKDSYDSRRLLFESPEQRAQSASGSGPVKVCATCAGLSLLSPVKFTGESLVIRLDGEDLSTVNRAKETLERQALNELGASAGRYINLLATEKNKDGDPAPRVWGRKHYAICKLARILPPQVFTEGEDNLRFVLYDKGNEITLNQTSLFATATLARAYQQSIRTSDDLNRHLGRAVRYFDKGQWFFGEYELLTAMTKANFIPPRVLEEAEEARKELVKLMRKDDPVTSQKYEDIAAYAMLLFAFTEKARSEMKELKAEDRERELSKLVQLSGGESPVNFINRALAAGQSRPEGLGFDSARLYFSERYSTSYEWAKTLLDKPEKEETNERGLSRFLEITPDDIIQAQIKLNKEKYQSPGDWKDFRYQVKLYLFIRYPKLMQ